MEYPEISMMSDRELLEELVESQRRAEKTRRFWLIVKLAIAAVILVLLLIYVPKIMAEVNHYKAMMEEAYSRMNEADTMMKDVKELIRNLPSAENGYEGLDEILELFVQRLAKALNPFR